VVRSVKVTGIRRVPAAEVLRAAGIRYGTPLIRIDTAEVARRVEDITQVQSARVSRDWPDAVVISVRERTAALALARDGRFALVDEFGVVVRSVAVKPARLPLLESWSDGPLRGSAEVRAAVIVLRELPARLRRRVQAVTVPAADQVTLGLRGGVTIEWGGTARPAAKAAELRILMRKHAAYYDVSDPGSAVTGSSVPGSAGMGGAGTEGAGTERAGTEGAGTESAGTGGAGTRHAGTRHAGPLGRS